MEKIEIMLSLSATVLGLLITTITFLSKFIKSAKAKKIAENVVKIGNAVMPYIEQAEKFVSFTGEEKKAYVMTKANQFAINNNIKFEEEKISDKIDEIVALCKQVNVKKSMENNDEVDLIVNGNSINEKSKQRIIVSKKTEDR